MWRNLSFVWLVPILALAVSLGLAWQTVANRGVPIEIIFNSASGIVSGETTLRYRDVVIGTVEDVSFTDDLGKVLVRARVNKDVAPYLDSQAQFWVVRPAVSTRGITGISTVLSGVYIEGAWDQTPDAPQRRFEGLDGPPLVQPGRAGKRITLITDDGRLLSEGAPVLFRGVEVGRLERPRLTVSTDMIVVDAFIEAPHDRKLNTATRFWDTSGFRVSISGAGLSVDFDSMATLLAGGLEFGSIFDGGVPVSPGHVFNVYASEGEARKSVFTRSTAQAIDLAAQFNESVAGLEVGAEVRLGGLKVGEVAAITTRIHESDAGPTIRLMTRLSLEPGRLGLPAQASREDALDFLEAAVNGGLRARLATTSLFSSALVVDLVELPDAEPAGLDRDADPLPTLPTAPSDLPDFTATAEGVFERINALPIEEMIDHAIALMTGIEEFTRSEKLRALPGDAAALLADARTLLQDEATRALPGDLRDTVAELRGIATDLRRSGALESLGEALEKANVAAANISTASAEVPALVEDLRAVAQKARSLEAEELITAAREVLESADAVIGAPGARELPETLNGALAEIRSSLAELREGGMVDNANAAMASARSATDALKTAAETLPELSARMTRLAAQAEALVAAYGARSNFNDETIAALRAMREAARSVSELARTLERDPALLIRGR
ncbi:MCE family protein [Pukyongiella litopenaei]|uniref:MCE family protein n=1 Tax=Pukyongiella litopenaei TaxID=2605946 RepID=A0A2S0MVE1_9RHOB|nr:MCE family protein [Pukyongiella litopenaei]